MHCELSPHVPPRAPWPAGAWQTDGRLCPSVSSHDAAGIAFAHVSATDGVHPVPEAASVSAKSPDVREVHVAVSPYAIRMRRGPHASMRAQSAVATSVAACAALTEPPPVLPALSVLPEHARSISPMSPTDTADSAADTEETLIATSIEDLPPPPAAC